MRILMPVGEEIQFDDKLRHLLFNTNVIDEIQECYDDGIVDILNSMLGSKEKEGKKNQYDKLSYILLVLLNEDVRLHNKNNQNDKWEVLTEEFIRSELVTNTTSLELTMLVLTAFSGSVPKSTDSPPNVESDNIKK